MARKQQRGERNGSIAYERPQQGNGGDIKVHFQSIPKFVVLEIEEPSE